MPRLNLLVATAVIILVAELFANEIILGSDDRGTFTELMRYTLKNVIISSISVGGGGGARPVENLTLNYTQIKWKYAPQKQGGGAEGGWNLSTNRPE